MADRDDTNSGVCFPAHQDQQFMAQGKINIDGNVNRYVIIFEKVKADGEPVRVLYERAGVLFDNAEGKQKNEKAPDFSGPLDRHPSKRVAAWRGEKDGRKYLSIKVSEKSVDRGADGPADASNGWGDAGPRSGKSSSIADDDIPF